MIALMRTWAVGVVTLLALPALTAYAKDYPARPIRIVTSEVGAAGDITSRVLAQGFTKAFAQPVVVDNRAGGVIAGDFVARSAPDGYTLLVYGNTLWLLPLMRSQMPYDPMRDFLPVTLASRGTSVLVVHPSLPVHSVTELVEFARARPGQLNYGSAAPGTTSHIGAELLKYVAKVDLVRVSFRGATSALNSLLSGQVHVMFMGAFSAIPQLKARRVRALAVASPDPSPLFPDLPTMARAGLPGVEVISMFGVFVPARTPEPVIALLSQEARRVLQGADVQGSLANIGLEAVGGSSDALVAAIKGEINRLEPVFRSGGIRD